MGRELNRVGFEIRGCSSTDPHKKELSHSYPKVGIVEKYYEKNMVYIVGIYETHETSLIHFRIGGARRFLTPRDISPPGNFTSGESTILKCPVTPLN